MNTVLVLRKRRLSFKKVRKYFGTGQMIAVLRCLESVIAERKKKEKIYTVTERNWRGVEGGMAA